MTQLFIQGKNVDLYEDETVNYNMKLADFTNFGTSSASYTNTFQVPATPKNNDLIRHYFNQSVSVSDSFNPRKRIPAKIEVDSIPFQTGYVLLTTSTFKHEKPVSYSFTFYSNDNLVFNIIGDQTLKSLDWSTYDYNPNDYIISYEGMGGGTNAIGSNDDVIFPLVQLKTDGTNKWTTGNLAANSISMLELRPAVRISLTMDLISAKYGIIFDSSGLTTEDTAFFESIYMYLPYEYVPEEGLAPGYTQIIPIDTITPNAGFSTNQVNLVTDIFSIENIKQGTGVKSCSVTINCQGFGTGVDYTIREYVSNGGAFTLNDERVVAGPVSELYAYPFSNNDTVQSYFEIWSLTTGVANGNYLIHGSSNNNDPTVGAFQTASGVLGQVSFVDNNTKMGLRIPNMKIKDFMNSIFRMMHLVMYSDDGVTYYINTWDNWRANGDIVDLSKYIDIDEANRGVNQVPQTFNFLYEETETILNVGFNNLWGYYYGDLVLYTDGWSESVDYDVSFNFPLWENIGNDGVNDDLLLFSCYDDSYDTITDEVMLICWKQDDNKLCNIQFDGWSLPITSYKVASSFHGVDAPTYALTFKEEQNPYTNDIATVSLYDSFYSQYYGVLLDSNVRKFTYKGYVPNAIVSELYPNDTVKLGDQYFIINKYVQNLTTQEMSIELFNFQRAADEPLPVLPDTTPPNMGIFSMDCATKVLTWTAATDNVGVTGYKVYRNHVEIQDLAGLTYTDSSAPTNQKNIYYIKAYDAAGNLSNPSNAIMCWGTIGFNYELNLDLS